MKGTKRFTALFLAVFMLIAVFPNMAVMDVSAQSRAERYTVLILDVSAPVNWTFLGYDDTHRRFTD